MKTDIVHYKTIKTRETCYEMIVAGNYWPNKNLLINKLSRQLSPLHHEDIDFPPCCTALPFMIMNFFCHILTKYEGKYANVFSECIYC